MRERTPEEFNLGKRTIDIARSNLGQKEATGRNDGKYVEALQLWASGPKARGIVSWLVGAPWCVMFATKCVQDAAKELGVTSLVPRDVSTSHLRQYAISKNLLLDKPEQYCIGFLKREGRWAHTFTTSLPVFDNCAEASGGLCSEPFVWSIDGNFGNAVTRNIHPIRLCNFMRIC